MEELTADTDFLQSEWTEAEAGDQSPLVELADDEIDPRFLRVSYSSLLDLHACPRLFQLNRLKPRSTVDWDSQLTFAYGHAVGDGIARLFISDNLEDTIWQMFLDWPCDLLDVNEKQKKSFAHAVAAVEQLSAMRAQGFLNGYEVAVYKDKPAAELSFRIQLPLGFTFRGHIDLVLREIFGSNEAMVLENKTSSANYVQPAAYKNSSQAIGYSVVLDKLEAGASSYSVTYLVQMTRLERFEEFQFPKSNHQRALWLRDILDDISTIARYAKNEGNYGIWPMRGESCVRFGKPCAHLDTCQLDTSRQMSPVRESSYKDLSKDGTNEVEYTFDITLEELLAQEQENADA